MNNSNVFSMVKAAAAHVIHRGNAADHFRPGTDEHTVIKAGGHGTWNADILATSSAAREFGQYIWEQSIPGKLYNLANKMPVGAHIYDVFGSEAAWLGEGRGAPVVNLNVLGSHMLQPYKVGSLVVTTRDLIKLTPEALNIFQSNIKTAAVKALDLQFWSADKGDNVTPAGVLTHALKQPVGAFDLALQVHGNNGNDISRTALVCGLGFISNLRPAELIELEKLNLPVIISQYTRHAALIDCSRLTMDFSGTVVSETDGGAVEMADAPAMTADQTPTASNKLVSLFQTNSTAIAGVTYCSWSMPDAGTTAKPTGVSPVTVIQL